MATFATTGANSSQIFPLFWKAVDILEGINLKVIAATADGASPNRKFFKMHRPIDGNPGKNVVYHTENLYSHDKRYIYFLPMSLNSGPGRASRFMWNGVFLFFGPLFPKYITRIWKADWKC